MEHSKNNNAGWFDQIEDGKRETTDGSAANRTVHDGKHFWEFFDTLKGGGN
jgi:hypothetical protein